MKRKKIQRGLNSHMHRRRSIRLKGYDYTQAGVYFITICTQNRECLFGDIVEGKMLINDVGDIIAYEWLKTAAIRNEIELDEWVIMSNHFHGIVVIADGTGTARRAPTEIHTSAWYRHNMPYTNDAYIGGRWHAVQRRRIHLC
ncbi:MAG: hypothetical protein K6360_00635 [Deltaproteobacteria bacterium]